MITLIVAFTIYSICFINLENTCYRRDSTGVYNFSLIPLFTSGFTGPLVTVYNLSLTGNIIPLYHYIKFELTNLANPYTAYYITNLLANIFTTNFLSPINNQPNLDPN